MMTVAPHKDALIETRRDTLIETIEKKSFFYHVFSSR